MLKPISSETVALDGKGTNAKKEVQYGKNTTGDFSLCQEKGIQMIDFKMTDIDGRWRHLSIPVGRLNEDTMQYGIGFDGSNYGYAPIERSDMVFVPDLDTAAVDPFGEVPTLTMIGDVMIIDRPPTVPLTSILGTWPSGPLTI